MASVFFKPYKIYYSIVDGRIHSFEKRNQAGCYEPITENYDEQLINVANDIIEIQSKDGHGYSVFLYKLEEEGKVKIPKQLVS